VKNTLQVPLLLSEVQILWKYSSIGWKRKASISTDNSEESKEYTNDRLTKQVKLKIGFFWHRRMFFEFRLINLLNVRFSVIVSFFQLIIQK